MKKLRPVMEAEVIWEFLRNEFHHHDFDRDRHRFAGIVDRGDLGDERQNAIRRALFYRHRGHMWNQLPLDTRWWRVALEDADLDRLYVLARTHWRKIGGGNCLLRHVVDRINRRDFHGVRIVGGTAHGGIEISDVGRKVDAIRAFSQQLRQQQDHSAIVLIGVDDGSEALQPRIDHAPVTILEGNHRLAAALLESRELLKSQFRVFFGASPHMARCCWYGDPTIANMLRYAFNRLQHLGNPQADLAGLSPEWIPPASHAPPRTTGRAVAK